MTMANMHFDHWPRASIPEESVARGTVENVLSDSAVQAHGLVSGPDTFHSVGQDDATGRRRSYSYTGANSQVDEYTVTKPASSSVKGHRYKGSADSVSYMKEEDSGETRWVIERRRTGETGEVELLEREVVEGRQI
jgi:hypothetical protein